MKNTAAKNLDVARQQRWLTRSVVAIGVASFCSDVSHETATTILPAFLATQIAGSPLALGLIEGVADGLAAYCKLVGGWITDRSGRRKPVAVAGYTITALATSSFALATQWWMILTSRSLGWMARGIRSPARNALLADSVKREYFGRAFGFERAADQLGAVIGPLLAIALMSAGVSYRHIFALTAIPGLMAAAALQFFVHEHPRPPRVQTTLLADIRELPHAFALFLLVAGVFGLGQFAPTLFLLRATHLLTSARGPGGTTLAIALFVLFNIAQSGASYLAGWCSTKIGSLRLLGVGYFGFAAAALGFAMTNGSLISLFALFVVAGIAVGTVEAMEPTTAAALVPAHLRGTGFGALGAANGLGDLLSSISVGGLWALWGPRAGFGFAAICNFASVVALVLLSRRMVAKVGLRFN